ncbi:tyrosine-protein phosphatase [Promicromonospora sp. MEB111]|uniref:tyrosine-protein phosphatase n=1 Tax=Promicromonospora sp. MEB111 TaxID=3040301 RepID=UPI00254DE351|nr:tyrosine-protein phosphatase [Promicromonospora sp. MEB111]
MSNPVNLQVWDGAVNLRDLGGLPLEDGGTTAAGRVWRSGAPEPMTQTGWAEAVDVGLTTVVDLRNPAEVKQAHDLMPDAVRPRELVTHNTPTEDPGDPHFLETCGPWLDHPRSYAPNTAMYPHLFGGVFRVIADAPGPVLVHCAAGRDRTGMITALLLSLTGVEHEAIAQDYERAFRGTTHRGGGVAYDVERGAWVQHRGETWTARQLDERVGERRAALLDWLAELDPVAYLRYAGLDEGRITSLRGLLRKQSRQSSLPPAARQTAPPAAPGS